MQIKINIDMVQLDYLLTGHMGRYSSWLQEISGILEEGFSAKFDREEDDEGTFKGRKKINQRAIAKGLELMANSKEYCHHFADFMNENADDITFDTVWQFIIFGKVIYS